MKNHSYKQCFLNNFNLLILYYMCSWTLCDNIIFRASAKKPFYIFTSLSFLIKLLSSHKEKLSAKKLDCKIKNAVFTRITFPLQKIFCRRKSFFGESFLSGKTFVASNLKEKLSLFPDKFSPIRYHFFASALAQCVTSSKTNESLLNLTI